jgi:hypothetical protein
LLSKPAVAAPECDCDYCSTVPNFQCIYQEHRLLCSGYTALYCP